MSKHQDSSPEHPGPESDELFDHEPLSDSDSEFLAELDRVLSAESDVSPLEEESPVDGEATGPEPDTGVDLDLASDLEVDPFDLEPETADEFRQPQEIPEEFAAHKGEPEDQNTDFDQLPETAATVHDEPQDPAADGAPEARIGELQTLEWTDEPEPESETEDYRLEDEVPAEQPDSTAGPGEAPDLSLEYEAAPGPEAPPEPQGDLPPESEPGPELEPELAQTVDREDEIEPEAALIPPSATEAPPPAVEAQPATDTGDSSSGIWNGLVALLAVLGLGTGAAALWQGSAVEQRLTGLPSGGGVPASVAQPATATTRDPRYDELADRLQALSRENRQLRAELTALRTETSQGIGNLEQQMASTLEGLQAGLGGLENQLQDLQLPDTAVAAPAAQAPQPAPPPPAAPPADEAPVAAGPEPEPEEPPAIPETPSSRSGGWAVNLLSFPDRGKAETALKRLRDLDVPASIAPADVKGHTWYRLRVDGFVNQSDAQAFAKSVRSKSGLSSAWVGRE